ncbi:MAG: ABC transporter permease [Thermomicrobiales bacterium]|nr:ABC transporter permease [Thermomicrobiales bacterium]
MSEFAAGLPFRFERVLIPSRRARILTPIASILLGLITGGLLLLITGENPIEVYRAILNGALGSKYGLSETLVKMTPLLLTGLGVAVAFRMQLWNIGAEGQFYWGAIGATAVALFVLSPSHSPWVMIPAMMAAGMIGGALWAFIPGFLRATTGASEIITSLLLNYIAIFFADYLLHGPWRSPGSFGFPGTDTFPRNAWLPRYDIYRVHLGLLFGLAVAAILLVIFRRTRFGYEVSVIGQNDRAARYAGMPAKRMIVIVMMVSGALAGLGGMSEVAGVGHQLQRNFSPGYGYTAIIVAWIGRLHPVGIILTSFLLAALLTGGDQLQMRMGLPAAVAPMLQGLLLFFLLGGEVLTNYRIRRREAPAFSAEAAGE